MKGAGGGLWGWIIIRGQIAPLLTRLGSGRGGAGGRQSEARAGPQCRCAAAGSLRAAGRPEFGPEGAGSDAALWSQHNALNTRLPPLCRAAPPALPTASLYGAAATPSQSECTEPAPARPASALSSCPARASARRPASAASRAPGPARIWLSGPAAGGEKHPWSRRSRRSRSLSLKGGRGAILHAAWRLGTLLQRRASNIPRGGGGGRDAPAAGSWRPTQNLAISSRLRAEALQRPFCSCFFRRAPPQNFCVGATAPPTS